MTDKYQPMGIAEGIYFSLSNEAYHSDPALSHSGMTKVLVSWPDYWMSSCHNPYRGEYTPTEAMKFGARSGQLLLEPKKFHEEYNTRGSQGLPSGKGIYLSSVAYNNLRESVDCITETEIGRSHFEGGYPEVAIFWRDPTTGIMLRVKIDYLRTFGAIDFKRIATVDNWGIGRAVKAQGLDIQNFLYLEGIKAAREMLRRMKPKALATFCAREGVDTVWINAFMNDEDLLFRFLFQRSTSPYIWEFRELEEEVVLEGANATHAAMRRYLTGIEKYGTGKPPLGSSSVKTVSQFHVPRRDYDYE